MIMRHLLFVLFVVSALSASGQERSKKTDKPRVQAPSPWGDFVEKDFPFFSSVLDCRDLGEGFPKDNLTPRGLILNLGHNLWACFDTELLRIACIWEGVPGKPPVTPEALAPGSYHIAGQKTKDGQDFLPKPVGKVWLTNGIYPGWQAGDKPSLTDPREPGPSREEVGRGPLKESRFKEIATIKTSADKHAVSFGGWEIRYSIAGTDISERWSVSGLASNGNQPRCNIERMIVIQPHRKPLNLILGRLASDAYTGGSMMDHSGSNRANAKMLEPTKGNEADYLHLEASDKATELHWSYGGGIAPSYASDAETFVPYFDRDHWPKTVITKAALSSKADAYVLDDIPLPVPNPWKRNVRLADIAFLNDQGNAAGVTFDGDVWLISGLKGDLKNVTWKRFASGLHEPMSLVARPKEHRTPNVEHRTFKDQSSALNVGSSMLDVELFVFDRNGIWKLVDTNNDGEADRYEMFCNLFAQTAETREFPNSMKLGPDGSLYLSKGGQEGTTFGKHNGTVIKVASDGKKIEVIGYGLRQPFIGVHPKTGLVTASDQQGNYVPSTPIHIIGNHQFYGHLPGIAPKEIYPEPITEPLTWIPHPVNPSGATQVWLTDAKMGPINDEMIHIGYNRPELFRVMMNTRFKRPQAAVMSFERDLDFGPLNAQVNPADGQLYVVGFQVWGTTAKKLSGLARLRYTDKPRVLLKEVTPTDKGLLLRFNSKLDAKLATDPASYSVERWNYKRTAEYGSPHLKLDGSTGQEWLTASSAYLSRDGMSVFVGIPDMKAGVHEMRIGWGLKSADGLKAENTAYFSPWDLLTFDSMKEGFGEIQIDLSPRQVAAVALVKPTLDEGARLYQMIGCMACHSTDGSTVGKVGPSWKGIFGTERVLGKGGKSAIANEAYLRESITNPSAKVVKGFEKFDAGMPIYAGILNESQIESLVLFIKSLK
jgi:cytochrome c2